jgi:hypothetical protein
MWAIQEGDRWIDVLTVEDIDPEGILGRAGFRERDIIRDKGAITDFFARLETARGGDPVPITVVDWIEPPSPAERLRREVTVSGLSVRTWRDMRVALGCRLDYRETQVEPGLPCVPVVKDLEEGSPFLQAGFQEGDVLIDPPDSCSLLRALRKARGGPVKITVVPWIDLPPLQDRPTRRLEIRVPARREIPAAV